MRKAGLIWNNIYPFTVKLYVIVGNETIVLTMLAIIKLIAMSFHFGLIFTLKQINTSIQICLRPVGGAVVGSISANKMGKKI